LGTARIARAAASSSVRARPSVFAARKPSVRPRDNLRFHARIAVRIL